MNSPEEIAAAVDEIVALARAAGESLLGHHGRLGADEIDFKGRRDLATVADREAEKLIVEAIRRRHPGHAVLAEEEASAEGAASASRGGPLWIVDPLDGTTNFVHGLPIFAVSIALFLDGEPLAGCVHAPKLGETHAAGRGLGARMDGRPVRTSSTGVLMDALLSTGFAYRVEEVADDNLGHFGRLVKRSRALRRCGSAALDLAWVAAGRYDGFWEFDLGAWDVAAGALLVREAGGRVSDLEGGEDWLFGGSILATNGPLHPVLGAALREGGAGHRGV